MTYEIHKTLMVSTGHVTEGDCRRLEDGEAGGISYTLGEYGYLLWIPESPPAIPATNFAPLSDAVRGCIKLAREQDCQYLRLDRDGPYYDGLERFDW